MQTWKNFPLVCGSIFCLLALFVVTTVGVDSANAYPRKVLFEDYTSTTCPPCAAAAAEVEAGLELVDDIVSPIAYHMNWPAPGNDPWYHANPTDANGMRSVYGVNSIPWFVLDGTQYNGARTRQAVSAAIQARTQTPSPLQITVRANVMNNEVRTHIEITSEQNLNNLTLKVALTELYYNFQAPTGQVHHYDAMLKMIPTYNGTRFNINVNQTLEWDFTQSLQGIGWHDLEIDNLSIVVFVQASNLEVIQSENYIMGYNSPAVSLTGWEFSDANGGDGDGRAEPGETGEFTVTLENAPNYTMAESITVTFTCEDDGIEVTSGEVTYQNVAGGGRVNNADSPFQFRVVDDFEAHPVTFNFSVLVQPGEMRSSSSATFMVNWPPFLVVDASNNINATELMKAQFGNENMPYSDNWNRIEDGFITYEDIVNYRAILWHSFNNNTDIINEFEADVLVSYLENGGTLIIATPYLSRALGNHRLRTEFLGVDILMPNVGVQYVRGVADVEHFGDTRLFLGGGSGIGFPAAKSSFTPRNGSTRVMWYDDNSGNDNGTAAVQKSTETYRTLTFGFPLESIGGAGGTNTLPVIMQRIWNWLQNPSSAPSEHFSPVATFSLNPTYPNPFNPSATVSFSLDKAGYARLSLIDISGREITRLVDDALPVGSHSVLLNAPELGLSNGLYYIKLESAGRTTMQKALYLR